MPTPIILKINAKAIEKAWLFVGEKNTYLDAVAYENDQPDQYGNSHVIKQNPPRELRDSGTKPKIIGNGRFMPQKAGQQAARPAPAKAQPPHQDDGMSGDEIPF